MSKSERQSTAQVLHNIADIVSHDVEQKNRQGQYGLDKPCAGHRLETISSASRGDGDSVHWQ